MNIYAPEKRDLLLENCEEDNCALHYHFLRATDEAMWGAILHAYDTSKRGFTPNGANRQAWDEYVKEVSGKAFGGNY